MRYKIIFTVLVFILSLGSTQAQQLSKNWVSYYGGAGTKVTASQYDLINNCIYLCGVTTDQTGIASPGSFKSSISSGQKNIFLARFDTLGNRLWATYYGGDGDTYVPKMATDPLGNVYISGLTYSQTEIASTTALFPNANGYPAGFIAKFNAQGQRIWSSYYSVGISSLENAYHGGIGIAFDSFANVYLVGGTRVTQNIATLGSHQNSMDTTTTPIPIAPPWPFKGDAFLVKFDSNGNRLWGTYYGGEDSDDGLAVAVSSIDNSVYIAGNTSGASGGTVAIVTPGAYQTTNLLNQRVGFLAKFDAAGNRLWGTYIHGEAQTSIINIKSDEWGNVYVYGVTGSTTGIATLGTHQQNINGTLLDVFLMKFNAQGQKIWGTYYGGSGSELWVMSEVVLGYSNSTLIVAPEGGIYIAGATTSLNGIATDCTIETTQGKGGYIAKFDTSGQLIMGSYYDAPISDISLDGKGNIYFSSWSNLDSLASSGTFLSTKPTGQNAGIFGKLEQKYVCPTDSVANLSIVQNTLVADTGYLQYKWYKNGNLIGTTAANQFPISDSGAYHVAVLGNCDCIYLSDTIPYSSVGISKFGLYNSIELSPNPAKDKLILTGEVKIASIFSYRIVNTLGKEMQAGAFNASGAFVHPISIINLPAGLYFLQLRDENGWGSLKFVKQ